MSLTAELPLDPAQRRVDTRAFIPLATPIPEVSPGVKKPINLDLLREELAASFAGRFEGCNLTGFAPATGVSSAITVYLTTLQPGDDALLAARVAAHDATGQTADQQAEAQKEMDFGDLRGNVAAVLADAAMALTQIDTDFTSLAADITALNAAATLAQARPPILDTMQVLTRTLNRQRRVVQSLVYAVRVVRWFVGK